MIVGARHIPAVASTACIVIAKSTGFDAPAPRILALSAAAAALAVVRLLSPKGEISPVYKGMAAYAAGVSAIACLWPAGATPLLSRYATAILYAVLFAVAVLPPLLGREGFTTYFARRTTPEAVWHSDVFLTINRRLSGLWAVLFALGTASSLLPGMFGLRGILPEIFLEALVPGALMLGVGVPANKYYPSHYQRKLGLVKEDIPMTRKPVVVAVNGSPHAGAGNTAMMIEMLREALTGEGIALEAIHLGDHKIEYCVGCGLCMEKGKCWIPDEHAGIVARLLAADGIVLASPVYFSHVTAQMKAFIDRSLAYGHKPRGTWKPGLAVSVSAGLGETQVAEYLAAVLRPYGAFAVGRLTALATGPGEFIGKDAVEARAGDLARDLARAIREKRRHPATDQDLRFYQFMGALVRENRDTIMRDDHDHWEKLGLYQGFEAYIGQKKEKPLYDPEIRKAWLKEMVARHKTGRERRPPDNRKSSTGTGPKTAGSCRELLQSMPLGFNPAAADGLDAVYQFEFHGREEFTAHLRIGGGTCTFHEGPADKPAVVVKSPAEVWMAIARGDIDGRQAFLSGKYKVEGDLTLLLRLRTLFPA